MRYLMLTLAALALVACSLPPERPVTKQELFKTGIYTYYTIKESPESVLAALNRDGEVVIDAKYRDQSLYLKLMAMPTGVTVTVIHK